MGNRLRCGSLMGVIAGVLAGCCMVSAAYADQWTQPTAEELSMTAQAGAPGAAAVYLFREEVTVDHLHYSSTYVRLKVLTEGGKKYANVELPYTLQGDSDEQVTNVEGRTIHPDGTVVPFTGKPYEREVVKGAGYKVKAKVFTLPDVTMGSILEYRYSFRLDDNRYRAPQWIVQNDLYLRKGHFLWKPTGKQLITSDERGQLTSVVAWTSILPAGVQVVSKELVVGGATDDPERSQIELNVQDVAPFIEEDYAPPLGSFTDRVLFYYSPYRTQEEFWKNEGKHWAKVSDKFIGPNAGVKSAVSQIVAPGDTPEQKLRKLYAAVMELENTDFTREHSRDEDKAERISQVKTTDDIWAHKRGSSDQMAALFVAMARAAGMKAYLMAVTSRDHNLFADGYLNLSQLDDDIAIVNVDGKEQYFDPGSRYCPFEHLAWKHTSARGLRQADNGSALEMTPVEGYKSASVIRVANLDLDEQGVATGTVVVRFAGDPALKWRQAYLTGDREGLERDLKESLVAMLPGGMEVKVSKIDKLMEYEGPLDVSFTVHGPIGSGTGKRLLVQGDLFTTNDKARFTLDKRQYPVAFEYAYNARDVVRITFPSSFSIESMPATASQTFRKYALYGMKSESGTNSVTVRRDLVVAEIFFDQKDYPELRSFYTQFESKDQEPVVLKLAAAPAGN
jgi:hypothetical protein